MPPRARELRLLESPLVCRWTVAADGKMRCGRIRAQNEIFVFSSKEKDLVLGCSRKLGDLRDRPR